MDMLKLVQSDCRLHSCMSLRNQACISHRSCIAAAAALIAICLSGQSCRMHCFWELTACNAHSSGVQWKASNVVNTVLHFCWLAFICVKLVCQ